MAFGCFDAITILMAAAILSTTALELNLSPDELVNARRQTRSKYFFYDSAGTTVMMDRQLMVYRDDIYDGWSAWSECSPHACLQHRYRKCADDSYMQPLNQMTTSNVCGFKYLAEERPCNDQSACIKDAKPSELLRRMQSVCGKMKESRTGENDGEEGVELKILNAKQVRSRKWPWNVAIYKAANYNASEGLTKLQPDHVICGGTLLAPNWVVTGAHCLKPVLSDRPVQFGTPFNLTREEMGTIYLLVRAGDSHLDGRKAAKEGETDHVVEQIIIHPEWSSDRVDSQFDVALLKLSNPVDIETGKASVACLPTRESPLPEEDSRCFTVGWGENVPRDSGRRPGRFGQFFNPFFSLRRWPFSGGHWDPKGERPTTLRELEVGILAPQKCFHHDDTNEAQICAGKRGKGVCAGDTGGGLYCKDEEGDGKWTVYGVMGSGPTQRCKRDTWLYNTVASFEAWVNYHVK